MKNQVGREIPDEILARMGKTGYRGLHDRDNASYRKASPTVRALNDPQRGKLCASLREALEKCELHDGMYFGFHHHFRDGDYVINMVMQEAARMGIRDITICATSMGAAHDALEPLIKQGVSAGIQSSGVRGKIGEAISKGKFKKPAIIRSHGGRVRAIEEGDIHLDVAFIGAPTADEYGNARAVGGKSDCGVLSYSMVDAKYADRVVVITDCLVPFPNTPASISMTDVDYVCVVDEIGDPKKIVSNVVRVTKDVRELMMAEYCTQIIAQSPYFKDGFSFQTGGGGAALRATVRTRRTRWMCSASSAGWTSRGFAACFWAARAIACRLCWMDSSAAWRRCARCASARWRKRRSSPAMRPPNRRRGG